MEKIKIGSLWANKSKDGDIFLSGKFTYGTKIMVFKNTYKKTEKDPDYNIFICEDKKTQDQSGMQPSVQNAPTAPQFDIPF